MAGEVRSMAGGGGGVGGVGGFGVHSVCAPIVLHIILPVFLRTSHPHHPSFLKSKSDRLSP